MSPEAVVREAISRITYKPGFSLRHACCFGPNVMVEVMATVPNSYGGGVIPVINKFHIDACGIQYGGIEHAFRAIECGLRDFENHEFNEFYMVDGKRPYDPHKRAGEK